MTHLQQALEARRAARRAPEDYATSANGATPVLTLYHAAGEAWSFLWSTLVSAWHDPSEGREKIVLTFLRHVVCVGGQNLDRIMAEIGEMRLHAVREQGNGVDCSGHSETGKTVVTSITVACVDEMPVAPERPVAQT